MSNKRILIKDGKALIDETGKVLVLENIGVEGATIKTKGTWQGTPVEIGGHSFYMCSNLTDIYIGYDGVPTLAFSQWFDLAGTIQGYINVHAKSEYAEQYASAPNWSSLITDGKIKIVGDYTD